MTHIYTITGMTCNGCKAKVQGLLSKVPAVQDVSIDLEQGTATIGMIVEKTCKIMLPPLHRVVAGDDLSISGTRKA